MSVVPSGRLPELAKYRLLDEIGHGGMATVYRALDVRLNREVAVKLMHSHLRDNHEAAARFVAEARAVAQLRHRGIVEIYDVSDEKDEERFLVAQLVRGPSLRSLLKQHKEIPPEVGACIGVLLCDALGHAHDKGIIHRDVKPENVLVELSESRKTASVKLTDFGIAKVIDAKGVTSTGQVLGSPAHMAPEQIEGGTIDARTDIFGVGVLVYECMVGHLPFQGQNPAQVLRRVLDGKYPAPERERPTVGNRWASIVTNAIAKEPYDRWRDVRAFGAAMRQELEAIGITDPRAEVYAYLSDSAAYEQAFAPRLVDYLVERAIQARERGDTQSAAGDLNRAVAYAPHDQAVLFELTSLASGVRRRELVHKAKTLAAVVAAAAALVAGALLLPRWVWGDPVDPAAKTEATAPTSSSPPEAKAATDGPTATASSAKSALAPAPASATASALAAASATTSARRPKPLRAARVSAAPRAPKGRQVRISATPGSVQVSIDGASPIPVGFGLNTVLSIGAHTMTFSTPVGESCCRPRTIKVEVVAGEGVQPISGAVFYRDANLSFFGGPPDAVLDCPAIGKSNVKTGTSVSVTMGKVDTEVNCFISGSGIPPTQRRVSLRAGQATPVAAPGPK